jgi:hypothetical protein
MSIPKKGARIITVDGIQYRWRIRHKPTYMQALGQSNLTFAVELAEQPGAKLVAGMIQVRPDAWLNNDTPETSAVLPSHVAQIIRQAIDLGWQPHLPGRIFRLQSRVERSRWREPPVGITPAQLARRVASTDAQPP